jgi:hypothetical protein
MMKSAKNRPRSKLAEPLNRAMGWRILVQGQMRSKFVVVVLTEYSIRAGVTGEIR